MNLEQVLGKYDVRIQYDKGRMFVEADDDFEAILDVLRHTFGIHEVVLGYELPSNDLKMIEEELKNVIQEKDFQTFKIETKRSFKDYPMTSMEVSKYLGGVVLKNKENVRVDVHHPEITFHVEIRYNHAYLYSDSYPGIGGYPVGTLGKGMLMLSGGIDSPVAGYLAMKRGIRLEAIYFESPPHTSNEAKNKVKDLAKKLAVYNNDIILHVVNFTEIQEAIYKNIPHDYLITIMRRMMYRISAIIASRRNAKILINGESIGQVASQTLTSMSAINEVVSLPVIRPLACFDKLDIIDIAKNIDTYETSILPFEDCCTIFVPKHPVINPSIEKCREYEELIPFKDLIYEAVKNHEMITIKAHEEESEFKDLL